MNLMLKDAFVHLPVKDLKKSREFFTHIGFGFNDHFSDEKAANLVVGESIYVLLLTEEFFKSFTHLGIADTRRMNEVIVSLSAESAEQVDDIVDKALEAGAEEKTNEETEDLMYYRRFKDLDGHLWEFFFMDDSIVEKANTGGIVR